jgi:hypothetical protein
VTFASEHVNCCVWVLTTTAACFGDTVTLTLQARPVNSIHVRENRRLVILEENFMAASPKTVIRKVKPAAV